MNRSRNIYRVLLVASFLVINAALIYGIAASWNFLNTGADRAGRLHLSEDPDLAFQPAMTWKLEGQEGRMMDPQTLSELERDYKSAWYVRQVALENSNPFGLEDYFTADARRQLAALLEHNNKTNTRIRSTTIEHHPELEFFSLDGKMVVLNDHNVREYTESYQDEKLVFQQYTTSSYQIILLLEDGNWRIRQMLQIPSHHEPELKQVAPEFQAVRGINYYPKERPWRMFGAYFDRQVVAEDFKKLQSLQFNAIRIFIPYGVFGEAKVNEQVLQQLKEVLELAEASDIKVLVSLFDFYGNYDLRDWTLTHRHAEKIVRAIKDSPALLGWDLKNEPDLDFGSRGQQRVLQWLREMANQLRKWDPEHPLTIGWSSPEKARLLTDVVDVVSFHYYEDLAELPERFKDLRKVARNKPVVLQEFGKSSYSGIWNGFSGSEAQQAAYMEAIRKFTIDNKLSSFEWTLYDFDKVPKEVVGRLPWRKAYQRHYGLINTEGKLKEAAKN
ncbi:cellulase family glycosylhydrolase [Robiginitalea sp. IMCC43444]|uniref:cellulase family glycosylhydrolase n=1 Tax=Robiginitalea sp. IMCC43444 TaxID=3459121 RepID=UPI00404106C9